MLIEFNVGNYLSFKEVVKFSMVASAIKQHPQHIFPINPRLKLVKTAAIYGANASGKSNLLKGMRFMKRFVLISFQNLNDVEEVATNTVHREIPLMEEIDVTGFKLDSRMDGEPSFFEAIFLKDKVRYRYGFEVDKKVVHREWLFYAPKGKEAQLFIRDKNDFSLGTHFKEGKGLITKTRKNALFLSVVAQFNGEISTKVYAWFKEFRVISGLNDRTYRLYSIDKLQSLKGEIVSFLKNADFGIEGIDIRQRDKARGSFRAIQDPKIQTLHKRYDHKKADSYDYVEFNLDREESEGTKKFFALSALVLDTLKNGNALVVDELDSRLHTHLTAYLVRLFNSTKTNPSGAQLIFACHDTNLLHTSLFRRDQIWFTEKNRTGATDLYSLIEYKIRNDASFEKDYLLGKYGAVPFLREDVKSSS